MLGAWAEFVYRKLVRRGRVSLVLCKAVFGIFSVKLRHDAVARHLRKNRCRRDRRTFRIPAYDRFRSYVKAAVYRSVHKDKIGCHTRRRDCAAHCKQGCVENVYFIYFCGACKTDSPCESVFGDLRVKRFALLFGQLFGIVKTFGDVSVGEYACSRRNGTGKRTAPRFIGAADDLYAFAALSQIEFTVEHG